jgi:hypothetical protein
MTTSIPLGIITPNDTEYGDTHLFIHTGPNSINCPAASAQRSEFGFEEIPYLPVGVTCVKEVHKLLGLNPQSMYKANSVQ